MFCKKCGNKFPNDAEFCNKCGTKINASSSGKSSTAHINNVVADRAPIEDNGRAIIKCGNCGYIGPGEPARTITGKILAWICIIIAWPITAIYFLATHKYRCPKCKSTFLGIKNREGVFTGQRGGSGKWILIIFVILIAIAMIAILAAIVLVNVTSYTNKAKDASIEVNLNTIMTNGAMFYNTNQNYTGFCNSSGVTTSQTAITSAGGVSTCITDANNDAFCACSTLNVSGNVFCVDSTGVSKMVSSTDCNTECSTDGACL